MIELELLKNEVSVCTKCPELVEGRIQTVFGEGPLNPDVMFCGESPGKTEAEQGKPFVGQAGCLLSNIISACGWKREEVYICNCIRCRPPKNRNPLQSELKNCYPFLAKQVSLVNPKFIVLLGSVASTYLLGINITAARGRWHTCFDRPTIATYHPAFLLRQGGEDSVKYKKEVWQDMKMLLAKLK